MVQIFIKTADDGKVDELAIIEIQGDLSVSNNEGLANKFLADLHYQKDVRSIYPNFLINKVLNIYL